MKPLFIKKNGTVSKVSGIIMNLIPSYTMAEYNALTHKPLLWVRTDEEYAQIPASDVSYGDGSVEDALDGLKTVKATTIAQNVEVTANTSVSTTLNFGSLDTSKILMVQVIWSNTANDQPTYIAYYKSGGANYIDTVQHKWSVTQTVRFKLLVLYAE